VEPYFIYLIFACLSVVLFSIGASHYNRSLGNIKKLKILRVHPEANSAKIVLGIKKIQEEIIVRKQYVYDAFVLLMIIQFFSLKIGHCYNVKGHEPVLMFAVFMVLMFLFYSLKGGRVMPNDSYGPSLF